MRLKPTGAIFNYSVTARVLQEAFHLAPELLGRRKGQTFTITRDKTPKSQQALILISHVLPAAPQLEDAKQRRAWTSKYEC